MGFHYYWMPDVYPKEFNTLENILESSLNVLCREHKVKDHERPNFIIRKSKVGPGAYFPIENKIIVNLQSYRLKDETPITLLCHEFGHFQQYRTGVYDLDMAKKGIICFDGIVYRDDIMASVRSQDEYEKLPWEADAIRFQKIWEPVIKKRLRFKY